MLNFFVGSVFYLIQLSFLSLLFRGLADCLLGVDRISATFFFKFLYFIFYKNCVKQSYNFQTQFSLTCMLKSNSKFHTSKGFVHFYSCICSTLPYTLLHIVLLLHRNRYFFNAIVFIIDETLQNLRFKNSNCGFSYKQYESTCDT